MSEDAKFSALRIRIEFERLVREGHDRKDAYMRAVIKEADKVLKRGRAGGEAAGE